MGPVTYHHTRLFNINYPMSFFTILASLFIIFVYQGVFSDLSVKLSVWLSSFTPSLSVSLGLSASPSVRVSVRLVCIQYVVEWFSGAKSCILFGCFQRVLHEGCVCRCGWWGACVGVGLYVCVCVAQWTPDRGEEIP